MNFGVVEVAVGFRVVVVVVVVNCCGGKEQGR